MTCYVQTENEEELEAPYCTLFLRIGCDECPVMRHLAAVNPKYTPAIAFRQNRRIPSREARIGLLSHSSADKK